MQTVDAVLATLGLPAASTAQRMPGYEATVWRAEVDGRPVAVRMLRRGRSAEAEAAVMRAAGAVSSLVPEVLATGVHDGCGVIVMSWCPGRPIAELVVDNGPVEPLGALFGRAQAQLNEAGICHLDFQPFNVLSDGSEVTGIVDWSNARVADPMLDVARTRVILELAPALLPDQPIAAFTAAWAEGYRAVRPFPADADLAPFLAEAARQQHADWHQRAEAGEVSVEVADAALVIARRWA